MRAGVHRATVFRIKSKFLQTVSVKNRLKPGRPRSTTAVQDRFLILTALRQRFKSSVKLTVNLRRLQEWQSTLTLYGTDLNQLASSLVDLAWGTSWLPTTSRRGSLGAVIVVDGEGISGATSFAQTNRVSTDFYDRRKRVWRRVGERYVPVTVVEHDRYRGGSGLVWAAVNFNHKTDLHIVQGNMAALKYRDAVLIPTVQPLVAQTGLTFQNDNACPDQVRIVTDYVQQQGLQTILANKIAGSLTHRAAIGRVRENLGEAYRNPHLSATGTSILSGVTSNSSENCTECD